MTTEAITTGSANGSEPPLQRLRKPFPPAQIGKLPKGGIELDFVGHANVTDRILDADLHWGWEPMALTPEGLPVFDEFGGLWIRLTICGVTRLGYGDAGGKKGPNAIKEAIGDALRNAGMRFGIALELWAKGGLGDPGSGGEQTDPHLAAEIEAANEARGELLNRTSDYGWTEESLVREAWTRLHKNLRNTRDLGLIRAFGDALVAEAHVSSPARVQGTGQERSAPVRDEGPPPAPGFIPEPPITLHQMRKLHALFKDNAIGEDEQHDWLSDALGIPVASKKNLTTSEADRAIEKLETLKNAAPAEENR